INVNDSVTKSKFDRVGGRAVGVPGTVTGLIYAHERYGRVDLKTAMAPAIRLAERGFAIDAHHATQSADILARLEREGLAERFDWLADRLELGEGETWVNREQARALRLIAARGASAFYEGAVAEALVRAVRLDGGVLTAADLAGYSVREVDPIRVGFGEDELLLMPPPSSGGVAIGQWFGVLERLGTEVPGEGWYADAGAHEMIEAMKHAFADRARHLADADFVDVPIGALLSDAYLDELAERVGDVPLEPTAYGSNAELLGAIEDGGTSHVSVVDRWGGAVACTETINTVYGSLLAVPEYGFVLNNEMDDFTTVRGGVNAYGLAQSDANLPEPGKRPLSSMSPTIVVDSDGDVRAVAGASGGPRIISATGQVLLGMLVGGADADAAVRAPRVHHQWSPDVVFVEPGVDEALSLGLETRGHAMREQEELGVVQAIVRTEGENGRGWSAASDPRKGGAIARE
ncbi:MAG: gamma-glutamyltransferase, partial [Planctomycetota bacterium]